MTNRKNPYKTLIKNILAQPYVPPKISSKPKLQDYDLSDEILKQNEINKNDEENNKKTLLNILFIFIIVFIFCNSDDIRLSCLFCFFLFAVYITLKDILCISKETEIDKKFNKYKEDMNSFEYWTVLYPKKKVSSYWYSLNGYEFEKSLSEVYKAKGYETWITPKSGDGGVDIVVWNNDKTKIYIQCKAFKGKAGVAIIRELYGVMMNDNVEKGIVACLGGFTSGAQEFAKNKNISLIDVNDIIKMI